MARQPGDSRCGVIAVLGAPNAGKSTLVNRLTGAKVSIVTPKVQTTRTRVLGITIIGDSQLVFTDTPGIFAPKRRLERAMVRAAWQSAADADEIVLVVDARQAARQGIAGDVARIVDGLAESGRTAVLALNKIDLIKREALLAVSALFNERAIFGDTFMLSALKGDGTDDLRSLLAAHVPSGPWLFPEDQMTDMPMRLLAAELTREQLFLRLHQEIPYGVAVETETWEEFANGDVRIRQVVYVERDSHKRIALGAGGRTIKAVGAAARAELAEMLDTTVHLFLHIKVREDWSDQAAHYREWGLDYNA